MFALCAALFVVLSLSRRIINSNLFLWCLDSWESPSGPCAPKQCLTSSIPRCVRKVSMRNKLLYMFSRSLRSARVPERRANGASASGRPMRRAPFSTFWVRGQTYGSSPLTAVSPCSQWGTLFITGLSAALGKNDCPWLAPSSACNTTSLCSPRIP